MIIKARNIIQYLRQTSQTIYHKKDFFWLFIWTIGIFFLWIWNLLFLNESDFEQIKLGLFNTFVISFLVVFISTFSGWIFGIMLYFLEKSKWKIVYTMITFFINIIRSIPQIIGILLFYYFITILIQKEILNEIYLIIFLMAAAISVFQFLEIVDLIGERIHYYRQSDFFDAMLVCGIKERVIINSEILRKSSIGHILNKLIALFGSTIFLQCSVDFIISVGLSTKVSAVNFPVTLGNLLARIDSKQDILAIGHTLMNPSYLSNLFFEHLQGITISFIIVFSLLCIYKIADGLSARLEL
ncbi:hypothetical protein ACFLSX_00065 [Calditrichota bacterium]